MKSYKPLNDSIVNEVRNPDLANFIHESTNLSQFTSLKLKFCLYFHPVGQFFRNFQYQHPKYMYTKIFRDHHIVWFQP